MRNMFSLDTHDITLIASEKLWTIGVWESTIPYIVSFLKQLWIKESEILGHCNGTIKMWVMFEGWNTKNNFIHPFTSWLISDSISGKPFSYWYLASKLKNFSERIDMADLMIQENLVPFDDVHTCYYEYAYHLDANLLWDFVRNICLSKERGICIKDELVTWVEIQEEQITKIETDKNSYVPDMVFDCSWFHEVIIKNYTENSYISFEADLPCNAAIFWPSTEESSPRNYTLSKTMNHGWRWEIPLQNRMWNGYVFSDNFCSIEQAKQELHKETDIPLDSMKGLRFKSWYHKQSWIGNMIAIGSSYGFVEPLEWTGIYIFCKQLADFKVAYEQSISQEEKRNRYNTDLELQMLEMRDFIYFHYYGANKRDTPFWKQFSSLSDTESIKEKDNYLKHNFPDNTLDIPHNIFRKESYSRVLIGLWYYDNFHFWDKLNTKILLEIKEKLIKMSQRKNELKNIFQDHSDFIKTTCD